MRCIKSMSISGSCRGSDSEATGERGEERKEGREGREEMKEGREGREKGERRGDGLPAERQDLHL